MDKAAVIIVVLVLMLIGGATGYKWADVTTPSFIIGTLMWFTCFVLIWIGFFVGMLMKG